MRGKTHQLHDNGKLRKMSLPDLQSQFLYFLCINSWGVGGLSPKTNLVR